MLAARYDTPETGSTTYTLGLLLEHMSTYAAASQTPASLLTGSSADHLSRVYG